MLRRQMLRPSQAADRDESQESAAPQAGDQQPGGSDPGRLQPIIAKSTISTPARWNGWVFCCGKVYYDLLEARRERGLDSVAIIRIEQLYPFPEARYLEELGRYLSVKTIIWCQDEPRNQGPGIRFSITSMPRWAISNRFSTLVGRLRPRPRWVTTAYTWTTTSACQRGPGPITSKGNKNEYRSPRSYPTRIRGRRYPGHLA